MLDNSRERVKDLAELFRATLSASASRTDMLECIGNAPNLDNLVYGSQEWFAKRDENLSDYLGEDKFKEFTNCNRAVNRELRISATCTRLTSGTICL